MQKVLKSKEFAVFILLTIVCMITARLSPVFLSAANLQNTGRLIGIYGIFSMGLGLIIITGGIDLSVGSVFALLGVLLSMLLVDWHVPPVLAFLIVIGASTLLGLMHGTLVTKVRMQPFIVTLCGLLLYRGVARYVSNDTTQGFGTGEGFTWLQELAKGNILGVPNPFCLLMVIATILFFALHRSVWGRYLFAVGRNEEAARYAGINSSAIITSAYVIAGALTGLSTILFAFYTNSIAPSSHGNFYELYGIAAAVVGGCSLRGGEGSIIGILLGAALLRVLPNLVNLLNISSSLDFAVMGAVIFLGVLADQLVRRGK
jgi:ribose transport system permease protein